MAKRHHPTWAVIIAKIWVHFAGAWLGFVSYWYDFMLAYKRGLLRIVEWDIRPKWLDKTKTWLVGLLVREK